MSLDSLSILFNIFSFQKPAVSPAVLMVFWKEGSLERMGKCLEFHVASICWKAVTNNALVLTQTNAVYVGHFFCWRIVGGRR